jgi:hypothetical protein
VFSDDAIRWPIDVYGIDEQRLRRLIEYIRKVIHVRSIIAQLDKSFGERRPSVVRVA